MAFSNSRLSNFEVIRVGYTRAAIRELEDDLATPKFPFNFLAASPCTPFRFLKGKEIFGVAVREVTSAPRGAV